MMKIDKMKKTYTGSKIITVSLIILIAFLVYTTPVLALTRDDIVNFAEGEIGAHYLFGTHGNVYPNDFGSNEGRFWNANNRFWNFETTEAVWNAYPDSPYLFRTGTSGSYQYWDHCQGYGGGTRTNCAGVAHYDCIGLVDTAYRNANAYSNMVWTVRYWLNNIHIADVERDHLQPGDVGYVGTRHIGVYVGNNQFVHANGHMRGVVRDSLAQYNAWTRFGRALPSPLIQTVTVTSSRPADLQCPALNPDNRRGSNFDRLGTCCFRPTIENGEGQEITVRVTWDGGEQNARRHSWRYSSCFGYPVSNWISDTDGIVEHTWELDINHLRRESNLSIQVRNEHGSIDTINISFVGIAVDIISPTTLSPASAGAFDNPNHIDVTVEVKIGTTPVTGLTNTDFSFKIGGKAVTAASLTDTSIPGQYKFDVTPPTQVAAGKYDLEVTVTYNGCSSTDTEQEAVEYTSGNVDVMLIIDRSGSMRGQKIVDAKDSAKLFINYMRDNDKAGVVSFSYGASYNYHLTTLTSSVKTAIKNAINSIYASGSTAMGRGLRYGLNDLTSRGDSTHPWAMVLLSDGYHNTGEHPNNVLPAIRNANIKVFTVGLGPYVDANLLRSIAANSGAGGGKYYYAPSSSDLKEIYDLIVGMVTGQQTSYSTTGTILPAQTSSLTVPITSSTTSATFSISWGGSDLDLVLYKPDGTEINPGVAVADPNIDYVEESTYEFYRVANPDAGVWTMEITAISVPTGGEDYTAKVRVASTLTISLTTDKDQYNQGETVKTTVSLTEDGTPLTGATVSADITLPDASTESLTLYDDGGHGDTAANDGVYANYFANTLQTGDYTVDVSATGTTPTGEQFSREDQSTFKVVAGPSLITLTPDTWIDTANAGGQIQSTFTVNDPAKIGELFPLDESTYAEYNGTHYFVYNESSIGGEPDYIIPAPPSSESLADVSTVGSATSVSTKQLSSNPVPKWVSLTATSLQTPTGDIIDVSNIIISPNVLEVPLGGSEDFDVTINIPSDAPAGTYTGKIVATAITGSDSIDVEITVISNLPPVADAGPDQTVERSLPDPEGAKVTLDGSGSYDSDGDPLTYEWTWLGGSATGLSPTVILPMGKTTVTLNVSDGMLYNTDIVNITVVDTTPPEVSIEVPAPDAALQDEVTLKADASDLSEVTEVYFYVREPGGVDGTGTPIGYEDLVAIFNTATDKWEYTFDTTQLPDGYYVILAKAVDFYGNEGWSDVVPFSIRNWAVVELLPASERNKAGRTMPVKFALRIAESVDPEQPFVCNEELEIRIYNAADPTTILQRSQYGDTSRDYRIDNDGELYITNFKTKKKQPAEYVVEIWRPNANDFLVGSFTFDTVK